MPITPLDDAPQHSYYKFINNFPAIARLMPVVKTGIADPTQFDPNNKYCTYQENCIQSFLQNATRNYAIALFSPKLTKSRCSRKLLTSPVR